MVLTPGFVFAGCRDDPSGLTLGSLFDGCRDDSSGLTLGSLFDGSGAFPLAGLFSGIRPVWASEIEPLPIRVTRKNLPQMAHLGDIHAVHGGEVAPVDVVTGGSPCQNLSLAGNKQGLAGDKSSLFFEQIRIIREMREATDGQCPAYVVWENVPGAFTTNQGGDFREVLQQFAQTASGEERVYVPGPSGGVWESAGAVLGEGWSLAWRVLDAQYWGVPQRRKRIFLVADFTGHGAGAVLFDPARGSGDSESGGAQGEDSARTAQDGAGTPSRTNRIEPTSSICDHARDSMAWFDCDPMRGGEAGVVGDNSGEHARTQPTWFNCDPLRGEYVGPAVVSQTLKHLDSHTTRPKICVPVSCFCISAEDSYAMQSSNPRAGVYGTDTARTLTAGYQNPGSRQGGTMIVEHLEPPRVRQITPLECSRLQGFPDSWTQNLTIEDPDEEDVGFWLDTWREYSRAMGETREYSEAWIRSWLKREPSDSSLYKMWGNGIALPCAVAVMEGIARVCDR